MFYILCFRIILFLFVHLLVNCITLTLRNDKYQFNIKYLNNNHIMLMFLVIQYQLKV